MSNLVKSSRAAAFLGCTRYSLYEKCRKHTIPHYRIDGVLYFDLEELEAWMRSFRVKTNEEINKQVYRQF